jgi:uncharacterized protein YqgC (DUF456 family)
VVLVLRWLHNGPHALVVLAMVAMVWPVVPGWLSLAVLAPVAVWFLGLAVARRRPADVHHAVMAACMAWMATMPDTPAMSHSPAHHHQGMGAVAGVAASYFLLAAALFLTTPLRTGTRGPVLGSLGHGVTSLATAFLLATHP